MRKILMLSASLGILFIGSGYIGLSARPVEAATYCTFATCAQACRQSCIALECEAIVTYTGDSRCCTCACECL